MGIPAFYRWLVEKYPLSVVDVLQEYPEVVNGVTVPIDTSRPNPNGIEFDNLYLDMNGIIHPCFHPEDQPAPNTYEDVYKAVFEYIDHIFSMVRPRKLLFLAIDGVAPRAKMNQQRARRFRAAKDAANAETESELLSGSSLELEKSSPNKLDSNVITPGTEFMASLSMALRYYIHLRLDTDPGWRGIKVILSDSNVPGEGEHKVASYIRSQRNLPGFDPNTRHCMYGLDADLIMLALATHEIHFSILRENVRAVHQNGKTAKYGKWRKKFNQDVVHDISSKKFQFLNIWVLRDYLEYDLRIPGATMKINLERLIDDFVFICLFVGNDFLPHVPSLEISEGAIDLLMAVYKKEFCRMGGYLTNSFKVDLERVEHFLRSIGYYETAIFKRRNLMQKERDTRFGTIATMTHIEKKKTSGNHCSYAETLSAPISHDPAKVNDVKDFQIVMNVSNKNKCNGTASGIAINNQVRLGEEGWKERYYAEKLEAKSECDRDKLKKHAVMKYAEGICWVMHYYYEGVCSWQWFYPYHYAPFASDFLNLKQFEIHFTLGVPFKPFDQLMGVLPAASAHALPLSYRNLMTDASSSIADYYPTDFELDMNGKRFSWQAVCKLPFIEESRLLAEIEKVEPTLTDDEKQRNSWALDALFVHMSHSLVPKFFSFYRRKKDHPKFLRVKIKRKLDPKSSGGMNGYIYISDKTVYSPEIYSPIERMETIKENHSIFVYYKLPPTQMHIPMLPYGVRLPTKSISMRDVRQTRLWHEVVLPRVRNKRPVPKSVDGPVSGYGGHKLGGLDNQTRGASGGKNWNNGGLGKRKHGAGGHKSMGVKRSKYKKRRN